MLHEVTVLKMPLLVTVKPKALFSLEVQPSQLSFGGELSISPNCVNIWSFEIIVLETSISTHASKPAGNASVTAGS